MSSRLDRYHVRDGELVRTGRGSIAPPQDPTVDPTKARFIGDPGPGNQLTGCNNAGADMGTPISTLDTTIMGPTSRPNDLFGCVREYSQVFDALTDSAWRFCNTWSDQGRVILWSTPSRGSSFDAILAGMEDATIERLGLRWKTLGTPVVWCLNHESETKTSGEQSEFNNRASFRYIKSAWDDLGVTNVSYVSPYMVSDTMRTEKGNHKRWHPDYVDANQWVECVDADGWDPYIPRLQAGTPFSDTPDAVMKPWSFYRNHWWDAVTPNVQYGQRRLPLILGETGVYSDQFLYDNSTVATGGRVASPGDFFKQMAADTTLAINCLWASSNCKFNAEKDPTGWRTRGFREYALLPSTKMIRRA